jgi:hypothetical protein
MGKVAGGNTLATESELHGEGLAFPIASSANGDAQELDEIRGSLFTHAFGSGLLGAAVTTQSFVTTGMAPERNSMSGFVLAGVGASRDLGRRCYLGVDARAEFHLLNTQDSALVDPALRLVFALRTTGVFGVQF